LIVGAAIARAKDNDDDAMSFCLVSSQVYVYEYK